MQVRRRSLVRFLAAAPLALSQPERRAAAAPPGPLVFDLGLYPVAGFQYYEGMALLRRGQLVEGQPVELRAEPGNPYDANAVEVWVQPEGAKLGYLPRAQNVTVQRLLLGGADVRASLASVEFEGAPWQAVTLRLTLVAVAGG
ncbi:MAG: hypothetical protein D6761_03320 [Candidatus Dadabacteria bacterium]|nr:MAG: hypothetical protein D6761_03320 [Candidatus Dadabacteria bacterium]